MRYSLVPNESNGRKEIMSGNWHFFIMFCYLYKGTSDSLAYPYRRERRGKIGKLGNIFICTKIQLNCSKSFPLSLKNTCYINNIYSKTNA